jgi:hypothetical protein
MAVGSYSDPSGNRTLAEVWSGRTWTIVPTPDPRNSTGATLFAVTCTSSTACVAVGGYPTVDANSAAFSEIWDGSSWTIKPTPEPRGSSGTQLSGVVCASATACVAVGDYQYVSDHFSTSGTLAETWNGKSWTIEPTPNPPTTGSNANALSAIACASAIACMAVGEEYRTVANLTLAESWNGRRWRLVATPNPSDNSELASIACASRSACMAVGDYQHISEQATLAESWNGSTWSILSMPKAPGVGDHQLYGVTCSSVAACVTVGYDGYGNGPSRTLAESWNGKHWTIESTPNGSPSMEGGTSLPPGSGTVEPSDINELAAVSCTSDTTCSAVGNYINSASVGRTLAERYGS